MVRSRRTFWPTAPVHAALLAMPVALSAAMLVAPTASAQQIVTRRADPIDTEPLLPDRNELMRVEINPGVLALVGDLDRDAYPARRAALDMLMEADYDISQLYAVLERETLSPEQRFALLTVVREQLLHMPRGAVGIRVDSRRIPDTIIIQELLEDLPAAEVLREGDQITHLNGEAVNWNEFRSRVLGRRPGERISVTVKRTLREGEREGNDEPPVQTLEFEIALGSAELLRDPNNPDQPQVIPIPHSRLVEAGQAADRFAPEPGVVEVRSGGSTTFGTAAADWADGPDLGIHEMLEQLLRAQRNGDRAANDVLDQVNRHLQWVLERSRDPDISDAEREHWDRFLQRYREFLERPNK